MKGLQCVVNAIWLCCLARSEPRDSREGDRAQHRQQPAAITDVTLQHAAFDRQPRRLKARHTAQQRALQPLEDNRCQCANHTRQHANAHTVQHNPTRLETAAEDAQAASGLHEAQPTSLLSGCGGE